MDWIKAWGLWWAIIAMAPVNAALRDHVLIPTLGQALAWPLSGLTFLSFALWISLLAIGWLGDHSERFFWGVGLLWLGSTVAFELLFGPLLLASSAQFWWGPLALGLVLLPRTSAAWRGVIHH